MLTLGFSCGLGDEMVVDTPLPANDGYQLVSCYIYVNDTAGDIVWRNSNGDLGYLPNAAVGVHPIAAIEIVSAGTVNGTPRTTTAVGFSYLGTYPY